MCLDKGRENMSLSWLGAIISTVCVSGQYTRSEEMLGSEHYQIISLISGILHPQMHT